MKFCTPTNKFDNGVSSAKTIQSEFGYKWRGQDFSRFDVAFFHAKTSNDIVPYAIRSIGSTWTNADTTKFGLEISAATVIAENIIFRGAFTATEAKYDQPTYSYAGALVTSAGNKVPGIPTYQLYADLAWRSHSWVSKPKVTYSEFGVDIKSTGKINVDSRNSYTIDTTTISNANMVTTSSYYLLGARASHSYKRGPHNLTFFGRLDNLLDKKHVGSVVVNQESGKYYEPGMPRNWIVGVKYSLAMN
jgi:iron complex outermembrane receptor protein